MDSLDQEEAERIYRLAAERTVELGNRLAEADQDADLWDIADGLLAGAVHFWLYSRQPCADPACEECISIRTAETRLAELRRSVEQAASESEYFHTPNDLNAGHA